MNVSVSRWIEEARQTRTRLEREMYLERAADYLLAEWDLSETARFRAQVGGAGADIARARYGKLRDWDDTTEVHA